MTPTPTDHDWISTSHLLPFDGVKVWALFADGKAIVARRDAGRWLGIYVLDLYEAPRRWKPIEK